MFKIRKIDIANEKEARFQIEKIGSDQGGIASMFRKTMTLNLKIYNLKLPQAHILKQEMLAIGGDTAVNRAVLVGGVERSDVLIMGTLKQYYELCRRLLRQPFSMKKLSEEIRQILSNINKEKFVWKIRDREIEIGERTLIMGVVNVTPDSFSDGGLYTDKEKAFKHAINLYQEGADILDIGGESTRPFAEPVSAEEEITRVVPVIEMIKNYNKDIIVSVDTYKSETAKKALEAGADIVNDISGLNFDENMKKVVAEKRAGIILMHTRGKPQEMQKDTEYEDFMGEVIESLSNSINKAVEAGIERERIVIDPGIGFGKKFEHNLYILKKLKEFSIFGLPILIGPSRKSFLGKITGKEAHERDDETMVSVGIGIISGAHIVRVHEVKRMRDAVKVADAIRNADIY
ncbi:MAG: dihydropteroate synthase [Proteobacteria bacterium]|nr:dihydropteroate synthase [Pseudomonadota bacterium]